MSVLFLVLRGLLIAVLAVAGVAKLADRAGAREAVRGFGVPESLSGPVGTLLPMVELLAAALLVPSATARAGGGLALVLMLAFCAAIARSLARGETPDCHCFGSLHSEPAGPKTLARNAVLAAAATGVVAGGPGTSATRWMAGLGADGIVVLVLSLALVAALAGGAALAIYLLRRNGELLLRVDSLEQALTSGGHAVPTAALVPSAGLPVGASAPEFTLPDLDGARVNLVTLRKPAQDLMLIFSDPDCGPCSALMPQVAAWQRQRPGGLRTVVVSRGSREANLAHAGEHGLLDVLVQRDREVSESFSVEATPSALIVTAEGKVASPVHSGQEQIRALVASRSEVVLPVHRPSASPLAEPPASGIGQRAPDPTLRTLEGKLVRLSAKLPDGPAVLVFWNPDCGFCERMLSSLRAMDAQDSRLVVISSGAPEANRAMELRAPVLLDDDFAAGAAFAATGTPSAVLIDARRRIAAPVAVGADAVLTLADADPVAVAA